MMELYFYLGLYIILILGVSFYLSHKNSDEDFLIAGRNRGWFQVAASKFAATIGISFFIAYTGYAYLYGQDLVWFIPGFIIAFLFFAFWATPRIYRDSREGQYYTQGDYVAGQTGSRWAKYTVDIFSVLAVLFFLVTSFIGGAKIIESLGLLSYTGALLLTSLVILCYLFLSGYRVVVVTDVIQAVLMIVILGISMVALSGQTTVSEIVAIETQPLPIAFLVGIFIYSLFSFFSAPDRYQLIFAAKSAAEAKKGLALALLPFLFFMLLLIAIGLYVFSQNQGLDPDLVFIGFYTDYLPAAFLSAGVVMLFAGIMSSADTNIYIISSYLAMLRKRTATVSHIRLLTVVVTALMFVAAYFVRDIIDVSIFAAGFLLASSVPMIYVIAGGRVGAKFIASLVSGATAVVVMAIVSGIDPALLMAAPIVGALALLWPARWQVKF